MKDRDLQYPVILQDSIKKQSIETLENNRWGPPQHNGDFWQGYPGCWHEVGHLIKDRRAEVSDHHIDSTTFAQNLKIKTASKMAMQKIMLNALHIL